MLFRNNSSISIKLERAPQVRIPARLIYEGYLCFLEITYVISHRSRTGDREREQAINKSNLPNVGQLVTRAEAPIHFALWALALLQSTVGLIRLATLTERRRIEHLT